MLDLCETNISVGFTMSEAYPIGEFRTSSLLRPIVYVDYHVCDFKGGKSFIAYGYTCTPSLTIPNPSFSLPPLERLRIVQIIGLSLVLMS